MIRVPNAKLRREYLAALEAGVLPSVICHNAGFVRASHPGRCDVYRLRRALGLVRAHDARLSPVLRTISVAQAQAVRAGIREGLRWVCAAGCGEHLREPDGLCGWCAEEMSAAA